MFAVARIVFSGGRSIAAERQLLRVNRCYGTRIYSQSRRGSSNDRYNYMRGLPRTCGRLIDASLTQFPLLCYARALVINARVSSVHKFLHGEKVALNKNNGERMYRAGATALARYPNGQSSRRTTRWLHESCPPSLEFTSASIILRSNDPASSRRSTIAAVLIRPTDRHFDGEHALTTDVLRLIKADTRRSRYESNLHSEIKRVEN